MVTSEQIKKIREKTGHSVIECKNALEKADGDEKKTLKILEKKGKEKANKKSERETKQGLIEAYIHNNGKIGVILELNCETDFVAKNEEFQRLAYDIAMQIAATNPSFLKKEEITEEDQKKAREVFAEEVKDKPEEMREKILQGKLDSYFKEKVLLEQSFIKDSEKTINNIIEGAIQKFGEKIEIIKFVRLSI